MLLSTSLNEIKSFIPCASGWKDVLKGQCKSTSDGILFPLVDTVESNSISDVCWLLGKRKVEIQILVRFARMCADDVAHFKNNRDAATAATAYAAANAAHAAAYTAYTANEEKQIQKNKQFLIQCINEFAR